MEYSVHYIVYQPSARTAARKWRSTNRRIRIAHPPDVDRATHSFARSGDQFRRQLRIRHVLYPLDTGKSPDHTCHILPPSEIDLGLCLAVFTSSEGQYLFHRIGRKGLNHNMYK